MLHKELNLMQYYGSWFYFQRIFNMSVLVEKESFILTHVQFCQVYFDSAEVRKY